MTQFRFPSTGGTYILLLRNPQQMLLAIGSLGTLEVPRGWLCYVGSALGPGGINARVSRHLRLRKRKHWHIDYLTAVIPILEVGYSSASLRREHHWAERVSSLPGAGAPVHGFGASDCNCVAHLSSHNEAIDSIWNELSTTSPIQRLTISR